MATLLELDRIFEQAAKERAQLENDIALLNGNIKALNQAAYKSAEAGDIAEYKRLKNEASDAEAELFVKQTHLRANSAPVSSDEILASWRKYVAPRDKELDKMLQQYLDGRKQLAKLYSTMIEHLAETLAVREHVGALLKLPINEIDGFSRTADDVFHDLPVKTLPTSNQLRYKTLNVKSDDAKFFYASGELPEETAERDNHVISLHRP